MRSCESRNLEAPGLLLVQERTVHEAETLHPGPLAPDYFADHPALTVILNLFQETVVPNMLQENRHPELVSG